MKDWTLMTRTNTYRCGLLFRLASFWIGVHAGIDAPRVRYMLETLESCLKAL